MKKITKNERIKKQKFLFGYAICELVLFVLVFMYCVLLLDNSYNIFFAFLFLYSLFFGKYSIVTMVLSLTYLVLYILVSGNWDIGNIKELIVELFFIFNIVLFFISLASFHLYGFHLYSL